MVESLAKEQTVVSADVRARSVQTDKMVATAIEASDNLEATTDQALIALSRWGLPKNTLLSLNASRPVRSS